jgi:hypothetical protein
VFSGTADSKAKVSALAHDRLRNTVTKEMQHGTDMEYTELKRFEVTTILNNSSSCTDACAAEKGGICGETVKNFRVEAAAELFA